MLRSIFRNSSIYRYHSYARFKSHKLSLRCISSSSPIHSNLFVCREHRLDTLSKFLHSSINFLFFTKRYVTLLEYLCRIIRIFTSILILKIFYRKYSLFFIYIFILYLFLSCFGWGEFTAIYDPVFITLRLSFMWLCLLTEKLVYIHVRVHSHIPVHAHQRIMWMCDLVSATGVILQPQLYNLETVYDSEYK